MSLEKALGLYRRDELVGSDARSRSAAQKLLDPNERKRAERAKETETV